MLTFFDYAGNRITYIGEPNGKLWEEPNGNGRRLESPSRFFEIQQVGLGDNSFPIMTSLKVGTTDTPQTYVDASTSAQNITLTIEASDEGSGLQDSMYAVIIPAVRAPRVGGQFMAPCRLSASSIGMLTATYVCTFAIPQGIAKAFWQFHLQIYDSVGHTTQYRNDSIDYPFDTALYQELSGRDTPQTATNFQFGICSGPSFASCNGWDTRRYYEGS
jgi:hypothetical protein